MPTTLTTYGPGGYDPGKPNGNVVGTADVPDAIAPPTPEDRIAALEAELRAVKARVAASETAIARKP